MIWKNFKSIFTFLALYNCLLWMREHFWNGEKLCKLFSHTNDKSTKMPENFCKMFSSIYISRKVWVEKFYFKLNLNTFSTTRKLHNPQQNHFIVINNSKFHLKLPPSSFFIFSHRHHRQPSDSLRWVHLYCVSMIIKYFRKLKKWNWGDRRSITWKWKGKLKHSVNVANIIIHKRLQSL